MSLSRTIAHTVIEKEISVDTLVSTLEKYNLTALLPGILKAIKQHESGMKESDTIKIESPFPLSEKSVARIKRIVGNDIAPTDLTVNTDLLSGFRARFRGRLFDGSAERIIKQLINS